MKKIIATVLFLAFILSLVGCGAASSGSGSPVAGGADMPNNSEVIDTEKTQNATTETNAGAPPAMEFSTVDEAIETIKAIKAAGPEKMPHPDDFSLYDKDYICLLKEVPLADIDQVAIMLVSQGIVTYYESEKNRAVFYWDQGYEQTAELTERYSLERYDDTQFFIGSSGNDVFIYWWENGDQFCLSYPVDINISPENVIDNLEVEKFDLRQ